MTRIEPYLARLYRYAFSLSRDEEAAKDLVQQCALKALGAKSVPENEVSYRAWLFIILRNSFIDDRRRRKVTDTLIETDTDQENSLGMEFWGGDERFNQYPQRKAGDGKAHRA
ncbi:MAG: sigma factor [Proteobacteria bacterium]|nr:sigma factor [Pseudomonadota bacterium]